MNPNQVQQTAAPRNDTFDVLTIYNPSNEDFEVRYNNETHAVIRPQKAIQLVKLIAGDSENGNIKHLIDRMCRLNRKPKNDPAVRAAWYAKIVISEKVNHMPGIPTIVDQARAVNEQLAQAPLSVPLPTQPAPTLAPTPTIVAPVTPGSDDQSYINAGYKFHPVDGHPLKAAPVITPDQIDTSHIELQTPEETLPPSAASGVVPTPPLPMHPNPETNEILAGIRGTGDEEGRVIGEAAPDEPPAVDAPNHPENPDKEYLINTYARNVVMMNVDDPTTKENLEAQSVDQLKETLKYDRYA